MSSSISELKTLWNLYLPQEFKKISQIKNFYFLFYFNNKLGTSLSGYGFPGGGSSKKPSANTGDIRDAGSVVGSGRSPGGAHGNPLQ